MKKSLLALSLLVACGVANAAPSVVNGFDLSTFNFDVENYSYTGNGLNGNSTASGTSNGISWSISPTNIFSGLTTTIGSYDFAALPNNTDRLHTSTDFTITFAQPVKTLIVALSNNSNENDSINFGINPSFIQGATFNSASHQITLNDKYGGLAWFENVNTLTFKNTNNNGITDGYDIAFHAIAAVPEPETYAMLLAGLGLMGTIARRRRQK